MATLVGSTGLLLAAFVPPSEAAALPVELTLAHVMELDFSDLLVSAGLSASPSGSSYRCHTGAHYHFSGQRDGDGVVSGRWEPIYERSDCTVEGEETTMRHMIVASELLRGGQMYAVIPEVECSRCTGLFETGQSFSCSYCNGTYQARLSITLQPPVSGRAWSGYDTDECAVGSGNTLFCEKTGGPVTL